MPGQIISICNNKGGVGKTTLSCNLGVALARRGEGKVLLIDLDSQCNATCMTLPVGAKMRYSLYELLDPESIEKEISIDSCIIPTKNKGFFCLPNVEETSGLEMDLIGKYPESVQYLRTRVREHVKKNYAFTIIDCPPNMGIFVVNALYTSDFVIVPNDIGSLYSLEGLRRALDLIKTIQANGNQDLRFLRLLVNKVDRRTSITHLLLDDIKSRFSDSKVFKTTIPINTALQQAEYAKMTIFEASPTSRAARSFKDLAEEICSIFAPHTKTE